MPAVLFFLILFLMTGVSGGRVEAGDQGNPAVDAIEGFRGEVTDSANALAGAVQNAEQQAGQAVDDAARALLDTTQQARQQTDEVLGTIRNEARQAAWQVQQVLDSAERQTDGAFEKLRRDIDDNAGQLQDEIRGTAGEAIEDVEGRAAVATTGVNAAAATVQVAAGPGVISDAVGGLAGLFTDGIQSVAGTLTDWIRIEADRAIDGVGDAREEANRSLDDVERNVEAEFRRTENRIVDDVDRALEQLDDEIRRTRDEIHDTLNDFDDDVYRTREDLRDEIQRKSREATDAIGDLLNDVLLGIDRLLGMSSCAPGDSGCTPLAQCAGNSCLDVATFCTEDNSYCAESGSVDEGVQFTFTGSFGAPSANGASQRPLPPQGGLREAPRGLTLGRLGRLWAEWLLPAPVQAADVPTVTIVANGASLGQSFEIQVADPTGQIRTMAVPEGVVLQPLRGRPRPYGANARLPSNAIASEVGAYCLDFAKKPPTPGQVFRVAPPDVQERFAPLRRVLQSVDRLADQLHPDSDPSAYLNAIRQYALWSKLEDWDEAAFGANFLERTKKNAENANVNWTTAMEATITRVIPGRWRDIQTVVEAAGRP